MLWNISFQQSSDPSNYGDFVIESRKEPSEKEYKEIAIQNNLLDYSPEWYNFGVSELIIYNTPYYKVGDEIRIMNELETTITKIEGDRIYFLGENGIEYCEDIDSEGIEWL